MSIFVPLVSWPLALVTDFSNCVAQIILDYVTVNLLSWYALKYLYISCFPSFPSSSCYYYLFLRFTSFLALFAVHYRGLLHKWPHITSIYSSYCTICCRPIVSHYKPSSTKQAPRTTTVVSTEVYTILHTTMNDTRTLSSRNKNFSFTFKIPRP